ncbi:MAG TPA: BatA domain-containing protein, partial [Rhodospirillales bacterium]|nr:BatA domain-containing protein [Rhodospirillales bacterium]
MLSLGPITFAMPWALVALASLPALWWLLRMTPPAPRRIRFPPLSFLARLASSEESVARTPWWLLLLRLALVLALILGCAQPLLNAESGFAGQGPVVLIVDDGWAAAKDWPRKRGFMIALGERAVREKRPLIVVTTAPESAERAEPVARLLPPAEALAALEALRPKPWPTDRAAALAALDAVWTDRTGSGEIIWLSDGLEEAHAAGLATLAARLQRFGPVRVVAPEADETALLLQPAAGHGDDVSLTLRRAGSADEREVDVLAFSEAGMAVAREPAAFAADAEATEVRFSLPAEISERFARVEIAGEQTAGAVVLADDRWRRRPVGLAAAGREGGDGEPPLLGQLYYLDRALAGFAEVRQGDIGELLTRELAMLVLPDRGPLEGAAVERAAAWVDGGGTLVRFAGPRLAEQSGEEDPLLPVRLRPGDRIMGGALSWQAPASLAPFEPTSPFAGLSVAEDVVVRRQVLAEPGFAAEERVWARLEDGTPLVTARKRGNGWLVLFHTTANADWSNLPLSGLFVEMLQRLVAQSAGFAGGVNGSGPPLAPLVILDGSGALGAPPPGVRAIPAEAFAATAAGPRHPPGFYGSGEERLALNLGADIEEITALAPLPPAVTVGSYRDVAERDLRGWLLGAALVLLLLDLALSAVLRGLIQRPRRPVAAKSSAAAKAAVGAVLVLLALPVPSQGLAQTVLADGSAEPAALTTRLAYVVTGDGQTDAVSRAGLDALAMMVSRRTAASIGPAVGVDPAVDELAFYPLLYWPL